MRFQKESSVLIVDDNPMNIRVLETMLKEKGYDTRVALNGKFALESASRAAPDIILMDVNMPDMDGYETCRRMKQHQILKNIPVIFISAKNDVKDKLEGFQSGGVDYIEKPFNLTEVLARINAHLKIHIMQDMIFRQYNDLMKISDLKDKFFHMIIHDMRSPLQGISGCLEIIKGSGCLQEKEAGYLNMMEEAVEQLIGLCSDALDINKMESVEKSLIIEELNIVDLFKSTVQNLSGLFIDKEITFVSSEEQIKVLCDPSNTKRILQNLLSNASKFSRSKINCLVENDKDEVTLRIKNDGPGIDVTERKKIFERYYQINNGTRISNSSGLGLSFCKLAVEKQGGRIGVNSEDDAGTEFWFTVKTSENEPCKNRLKF